MTDAPTTFVDPDAATEHLCRQLRSVSAAMGALGLPGHLFDRVAKKLQDQDREIIRLRSDPAYLAGRKDGYETAFATGLTGENSTTGD
tara:strand:+ start:413 stop:676 length:264 start_codon:yes stop_codon:yes gene_type:complete